MRNDKSKWNLLRFIESLLRRSGKRKHKEEPLDGIYYPKPTLERFLQAQEKNYERALNEVTNGLKLTHWIWYVFPQMKGLGSSCFSNLYGIEDEREALNYLKHPILSKRLREVTEAMLKHKDKLAEDIFGGLDAMKVRSSMTLFDYVRPGEIYAEVLGAFYDGERCQKTLSMLQDIVAPVIEFAKSRWSLGDLHGPSHWQRVEYNAYLLSYENKDSKTVLRNGIDFTVVRCFAYLHDCCREDDGLDPDHGLRSASLVKSLRDTLLKGLTDEEMDLLERACRFHTKKRKTGNITIDTCFDADRMDLGRVGTIPDPARMATEMGSRLVSYQEEYRKHDAFIREKFKWLAR